MLIDSRLLQCSRPLHTANIANGSPVKCLTCQLRSIIGIHIKLTVAEDEDVGVGGGEVVDLVGVGVSAGGKVLIMDGARHWAS
jgi:hypothetical protein